jgi:hypothetical protein
VFGVAWWLVGPPYAQSLLHGQGHLDPTPLRQPIPGKQTLTGAAAAVEGDDEAVAERVPAGRLVEGVGAFAVQSQWCSAPCQVWPPCQQHPSDCLG